PDIRLLNLGDQLPTPEQSRPATPPDIARRRAAATALLPEKDKLNIDFFDKIQTLGTGTFARVWLVRPKSDGDSQRNIWALKVLRKADVIKLKQVEHVRNERRTLQAASGHPFITSLITTFSDSHCLYMLLEYCPGGELFTYLRRADKFDVKTSQFYASEIVLILEFLHAVEGIAYRDLKPENLLLDNEGH
ncbi:serine/threonine protein kinase, AGC, partial [Ascosphaera atra]